MILSRFSTSWIILKPKMSFTFPSIGIRLTVCFARTNFQTSKNQSGSNELKNSVETLIVDLSHRRKLSVFVPRKESMMRKETDKLKKTPKVGNKSSDIQILDVSSSDVFDNSPRIVHPSKGKKPTVIDDSNGEGRSIASKSSDVIKDMTDTIKVKRGTDEADILIIESKNTSKKARTRPEYVVDDIIANENDVQKVRPNDWEEADAALARALMEEEYEQYQSSSNISSLQEQFRQQVGSASGLSFAEVSGWGSLQQNPANYLADDALDNADYNTLLELGDRIGQVKPKGLLPGVIASLASKRFTKKDSEKMDSKGCVICMSDFKSNEILSGLPCCHFFHGKCIRPWLKESVFCPV